MADSKPQPQTAKDAPKQSKPEVGKPEDGDGSATVQAAETAVLQARLTAEEQASDATETGFRMMSEMTSRLADGVLCLQEISQQAALLQADTLRRMATCRDAQELADIQQNYWQACLDQAVESGRRLGDLQMGFMPAIQAATEPLWRRAGAHMERSRQVH